MSCSSLTLGLFAVIAACTAVIPVKPTKNLFIVPVQKVSPKPYEFGYKIADGLGMKQHRQEVADATGAVKGSYGYVDELGVSRVVEYTADDEGYKAVIRTNEPGIASQNSANVMYYVQPPPQGVIDMISNNKLK